MIFRVEQGRADDLETVTSAVLTASRLLVAIAARSLAGVEEKVTLAQFRMLVVASQGETKLVTLAERLGVNPSTAKRMADRLAAGGLMHREINPANRRETLMRLTAEGRQVLEDVFARRTAELSAILARMTAGQRQALIAAMTAFNEAGGEVPANVQFPLGWTDTRPA